MPGTGTRTPSSRPSAARSSRTRSRVYPRAFTAWLRPDDPDTNPRHPRHAASRIAAATSWRTASTAARSDAISSAMFPAAGSPASVSSTSCKPSCVVCNCPTVTSVSHLLVERHAAAVCIDLPLQLVEPGPRVREVGHAGARVVQDLDQLLQRVRVARPVRLWLDEQGPPALPRRGRLGAAQGDLECPDLLENRIQL